MVYVIMALDYNRVTFTSCAVFAVLLFAVYTTHLGDNKPTTISAATTCRPTSSSSNASDVTSVDLVEKFVSLCPVNFDRRRLGNKLFNFAAMMYVAELTGRRIVMPRGYVHRGRGGDWIDRWFEVPAVEVVDEIVPRLCPCRNVTERRPLAFERSVQRAALESHQIKTLLVCGWFQSWRYVTGVDGGQSLRHQLRWRPEVTTAVRRFLVDHRPPGWNSTVNYARVGVHIRVGDLVDRRKLAFGYTVPGRSYFQRAIAFFVRHYGKNGTNVVQFVVTTDDLDWTQTHLRLDQIVTRYGLSATLVYSTSIDAGFDLALLSACDDIIMSTGTYGWWAGWLAAGKTVYYRRWPRRGSPLDAAFRRRDFFPPRWIAL